jgi:O-antigen/teichoic acid export membrane protein
LPSEPLSAADKTRQMTNAAIYVLPLVIGNLVPIVTLPIFMRLLTPRDFGAWALAGAYGSAVGGLAGAGLPIAYERNFFEQKDPENRWRLLYSVVAFTLVSFALCAGVTWLVREPVSRWLTGESGYESLVMWSVAAAAVAGVKSYYMTFLRNTERAAAFAVYMIGERLLTAVISVALVAAAGAGVIGLAAGQFVAGLVIFVAIAFQMLRASRPMLDRALLVDALRIGYPLMPRVLLNVVASNVDKYLIGRITSLGGVGIYSIGQRVATIAFTYMTALQNVYGPRVYTLMFSGDADASHAIGRYLTPFAYASTLLSFLIAAFAEEILTVLAPAEYRAALPIIAILATYYAVLFFGKMPQFARARKTHLITVMGAVSAVASVTAGALGIWMFGTVGAAWGTLLAGTIVTTITAVLGQRCFRIEWEYGKLAGIFGCLFAAAWLTIGLRALDVPYVWLLIAKLASTAVFIWLGVGLGILTAENLRIARSAVLGRIGFGGTAQETRA